MAKKKLIRFAENDTFHNFFQPSYQEVLHKEFRFKNKWNSDFFRNDNLLVIELGCGKGEYTVGLAYQQPDRNYIGMDIKGARMWQGCKTAMVKGMTNIAFIRARIEQIGSFFGNDEVSEIWLPFPDPQPKNPYVKKRLISPEFLERYKSIIREDNIIHLKTDNPLLYEYTLKVITKHHHQLLFSTTDLYGSAQNEVAACIKTFYEKMFLKDGLKIYYLRFRMEK